MDWTPSEKMTVGADELAHPDLCEDKQGEREPPETRGRRVREYHAEALWPCALKHVGGVLDLRRL